MNFSVIIPTLNCASTIHRALDSVIRAADLYDINRVEILIVDNGSSDKTIKNTQSWVRNNSTITTHLFESQAFGPGPARNLGIMKAKYPYLLFLDSDDYFSLEIFITLNECLKKQYYDFVFFNYTVDCAEIKQKVKKSRNLQNYSTVKSELVRQYSSMETDNSVIAMCWTKTFLCKTNNISFSEGIYEDILFLGKSIVACKSYSILNQSLYFKVERLESISNSLTLKHIYYYMKSWSQVFELFVTKNAYLNQEIDINKGIRGAIGQMVNTVNVSDLDENFKKECRGYLAELIERYFPQTEKIVTSSEGTRLDSLAINFIMHYAKKRE